ncbi:MAG: hypothetical protein V1809_08835 [Planctomycetota bacterium]
MNEQDMIGQYYGLFEQIRRMTTSDEIALAILQEMGKDARMSRMQTQRENRNGNGDFSSSENTPATPKQIGFMKKLGIEVRNGLTKREASTLIDEAQGTKATEY